MIDHQQLSPQKLAYKKIQNARGKGLKLNAAQVKAIKTILTNPNRKLTYQQIAEKYNISPMTVYRIKKGENWKAV
jgi:DNA invertase Pin-like site-specific DNA recombinase